MLAMKSVLLFLCALALSPVVQAGVSSPEICLEICLENEISTENCSSFIFIGNQDCQVTRGYDQFTMDYGRRAHIYANARFGNVRYGR